ncbi:MAG: hypothetical protein JWQ29_1328 [Phenylobacterium sp.]|nr:hypothetical protein [Phenylobacterium sp.]
MAQRLSNLDDDRDDRSWIDACVDRLVARGAAARTPSDALLQAAVRLRLARDRLLDAHAIVVEVEDGVVSLEGAVRSPSDRNLADMLAHEVSGAAVIRVRLAVQPDLPGRPPVSLDPEPSTERDRSHDPLPPFIP